MIPETRYTKTADGVSIAYQVVGEGPIDIVLVTSAFISNMEIAWEWPLFGELFNGLAARGRLLLFDRRGAGLSDGVSGEHVRSGDSSKSDGLRPSDLYMYEYNAREAERARLIAMTNATAQGDAPDTQPIE